MRLILVYLCAVLATLPMLAQPQPGDLFREYGWAHPKGDAGGSLRVGGRLDYGGEAIPFSHMVDLHHATRAEVVIEKLLCHDGTRGLAISWNGNEAITFPEAKGIPEPQWDYQYFTYPVVEVPLEQLRAGAKNAFALSVSKEHSWNWPQNLIYGLQLRVFYDPAKKAHVKGAITSPKPGESISSKVELSASASGPAKRVDYIGRYRGVNWEGDGTYRQWHYTYFKGALTNHLGSAAEPPWRVGWDTSWIPDQSEPVEIAARIMDESGLAYLTEAVRANLVRPGLSVELCEPYDVPKKWVTRAGEKTQKFRVAGNLERAVAAQLVWSSWSPGYMNGLFINGKTVFESEGPRYACYWHRMPLADLSVLKAGENTLTTGMTPKHDGKMVHGMEVNWPGIMVLIQYRTEQ